MEEQKIDVNYDNKSKVSLERRLRLKTPLPLKIATTTVLTGLLYIGLYTAQYGVTARKITREIAMYGNESGITLARNINDSIDNLAENIMFPGTKDAAKDYINALKLDILIDEKEKYYQELMSRYKSEEK